MIPDDIPPLITKMAIDNYAEELVKAIIKAVQDITPRKKRSPHSK